MASEGVVGRENTPTLPSTEQPARTVSPTSVRSYLQPVMSLDNDSRDTLKALLHVTIDLRRHTSRTHRIQRGSPGAGALGSTLAMLRPRVNDITNQLSEVFKTYDNFPGMYLVSTQFPVFRDVLNGNFNDGGNEPGYRERVHLLEKLMYLAGTLRGHIEMVLEQHEYWRAKLAGQQPSRLARRLNFNQDVDPAESNTAPLVGQPDVKQELLVPSPEHTFKVSVNLPEEAQTAIASLWEEQKFSDIDFIISGQRIPAHKVVLAAQSQYFECMLYGNMREATMSEIPLEGVAVSAFRKVLQFAYTGSLVMDNAALQDILEVTSVADRFGFVALKEALGDQLSHNHISLDTVLLLLVHSDMYHLQQLYKACLQFIENKAHSSQILKHHSLLGLPEESLIRIISRDTFVVPENEIFEAVRKWKEHNEKSVEEVAELIKCVRLSEFSSAEKIFREVEPTGLLDEKSILAGVRVLCKPCVTEMNPRGRKEYNKNLFTSPMVVFDPTTPPAYHVPLQHGLRLVPHQPPPQQYVADTIIDLGVLRGGLARIGSREMHSIIALDDLYIINYLHFKGYPSVSDEEQLQGKCFSYTVSVSRDKQSWLKLFDYETYSCRGAQHLPFPKQAARYIRMDLKWREDTSRPLPLQFSACCLVNHRKPYSFLPNGVIAPQYDHDVVTVPSSGTVGDSQQICAAYFRQPYSAAYIRFSLECSDENVSSVDISVSVGLLECGGVESGGGETSGGSGMVLGGSVCGVKKSPVRLTGGLCGTIDRVVDASPSQSAGDSKDDIEKHFKNSFKLEDMDNIPLNTPVSVDLKERIVSYVMVTIRAVSVLEKVAEKVPSEQEKSVESTEAPVAVDRAEEKEAITSPSLPKAAPRSARKASPISSGSAIKPSSSGSSLVTSVPSSQHAIQAEGGCSPGITSVSTRQSGGTRVNEAIAPQGFSFRQPPVPPYGLQLGTGQSIPQAPSTGLQLGTPQAPDSGLTYTIPQIQNSGLHPGTVPLVQDCLQFVSQAPDSRFQFGTVVQPTQQAPSSGLQPGIGIAPHAIAQPLTSPLRHPNRIPTQQAAFFQLPQLQQTSVVPSPTKPAFKIVDVVCKSSLQ